jgi:hypothetical protein
MIPRIFINSNLTATIPCAKCGQSYQKDVSKFIGHETQVRLKYKCKCQNSFSVLLERRRFIRKEVRLSGSIIVNQEKIPITIVDISKHGIRLKLLNNISLKLDDVIEIDFTLDDSNRSKISKNVRIKRFMPPITIGCEFLTEDHSGNLGKYFLFNFNL